MKSQIFCRNINDALLAIDLCQIFKYGLYYSKCSKNNKIPRSEKSLFKNILMLFNVIRV